MGEGEEAGEESRQLRIQPTNSNGRYQMNRDPKLAVRKLFHAQYLSNVFRFHRVIFKREWIRHEQTHAHAITVQVRLKINSVFRYVRTDQGLFEMFNVWIRRSDAQFSGDLCSEVSPIF
jgi:hypothetical protein